MHEAVQVSPFLDNDSETFTYVVQDTVSKCAVVIDPVLGFDYKSGRTNTHNAEQILDFIKQHDLKVEWVLETHAHADHLSAAPFFKENTSAKIAIGSQITQVQETFKQVFNLEQEFLPNGNQFDRLFSDGDLLNVGNIQIKVMHVPGHTPADIAYLINDEMAFVGDTIFMPDVGTARCDFPGGSANDLYDSITKILSLPSETQIYVCHDYPTKGREHQCMATVADQKANNIHVKTEISKEAFISKRESRDATLPMPQLIIPSIQINIRAGYMPPAQDNGQIYLTLPINQL